MKASYPLLALAIGVFGIDTIEFSPMGLLPVITKSMDASILAADMLIGAYAVDVMVGAPLMALLLFCRTRHNALIFLIAIFTLSSVLPAISPDYTTLTPSRVLTGLSHGVFFGLSSVVAASVTPKHKQASAVTMMFMGLTIASIGDAPAATWLGETISWRMSFMVAAGLGVITMVNLFFSLPKGGTGKRPDVRNELAILMRPQALSALLITVPGTGAILTLYTYISPILHAITHATLTFATGVLVLVGVGFSIGNYFGGKLADRPVNGTLKDSLLLLMAIMLVIPLLARNELGVAVSMVIWGAATFAIVPPLQMRVTHVANRAPGLPSSVNIGTSDLGNTLGIAAGGAVVSDDLGYSFVSIMGVIVAGLVLLLMFISARRQPEKAFTTAS